MERVPQCDRSLRLIQWDWGSASPSLPPALVALALELRAVWRLLAGLVPYRRVIAIAAALVVFVLGVCVVGFALSALLQALVPVAS